MIGSYIGTARSVLDTGEYRAIYLTHGALPAQLQGGLTGLVPETWEHHRDRYIREAQEHSIDFVQRAAAEQGCAWFCDSFPRNVFIAPLLRELFPDALFVLTLRHYTGVVQSLLRLGTINLLPGGETGVDWFNPTAAAAGAHWSRHYQAAMELPWDRTIPFGYDRFCVDPQTGLAELKGALVAAGFPVHELDDRSFAESHGARFGEPQATVGRLERGGLRLQPRPSYDAAAWTEAIEADVRPAVAAADSLLAGVFPAHYSAPAGYPPPGAGRAATSASPAPTGRAGGVEAQAAAQASRRLEPAPRPVRSPRTGPPRDQGPRRSGRGRPASGR